MNYSNTEVNKVCPNYKHHIHFQIIYPSVLFEHLLLNFVTSNNQPSNNQPSIRRKTRITTRTLLDYSNRLFLSAQRTKSALVLKPSLSAARSR